MAIANALSKTALKIIKQFGRDVTLNTVTDGEYNPDTGMSASSTATTIKAVKGVYKSYDVRGGKPGIPEYRSIQFGDAPLYTTSSLKNDDTITIGTQNYSIVSVEEYSVESSVVLYVANIRKV